MGKLGISIYPNHSTPAEDQTYIDLAAKYGFERLFTCLLSVEGNKEQIIREYRETIEYAKERGFEVIADISPRVFGALDISYSDLSFFKEIGASGIRLDLGYSGNEESIMTHNEHDLLIEINMSNNTPYVDQILSYQPNTKRLIGSHNFYPHRYAGLAFDHFVKCSERFKMHGLRTAAFVSSHEASFGPWPVVEGLPTLEEHRELPIETQAKHLFATGLIDDVMIGNAYASERELEALRDIDQERLTLKVQLEDGLSDLERKIVLEEFHFYRGDVSDYLVRSTQSRVKYKGEPFPPHHTRDIERGDILIESDLYGQYAGELQIALKPMKNSGKTNVVGQIVEEERFLLNYLAPWGKFAFTVRGDV